MIQHFLLRSVLALPIIQILILNSKSTDYFYSSFLAKNYFDFLFKICRVANQKENALNGFDAFNDFKWL
jgi:hypothetical protein